MKVAALYVETNGVYADLPDVELWDEARDARLYAGPWPVVAHPPCGRWCQLASVNQKRWGAMIGDDGVPRGKPRETFDTAEAAILAAHRYEREEWTEYGVSLGKGVLDD